VKILLGYQASACCLLLGFSFLITFHNMAFVLQAQFPLGFHTTLFQSRDIGVTCLRHAPLVG
jgi:sterol desaturase/sphingolipid hydroxylase (fatty acid hydroxylase superfamily)